MTTIRKKVGGFIVKYPLISFFMALATLLIVIIISNSFRVQEDVEKEDFVTQKEVQVIEASNGKYAELSGQVEKDGVVTIYANVPGIVHKIYVEDGQSVYQGQHIAYLSDTYGGGNSAAIAYQIAKRQAQLQDETFEKRISVIDDQRDDVKKTNDLEFEIARKQFTLQKRDTEANKDITTLQKQQAAVGSARYNPTSPFKGVIDRVFVSKGEFIGVGDRIAVVNADEQTLDVSINVSAQLASVVDVDRPSLVQIGDKEIEVMPKHLSRGAADEQSYVLTYVLDNMYANDLVNNEYVAVNVPIESRQDGGNQLLVPLDAVRLMSDKSIIFIVEDGFARAREVEVGEVVGGHIFIQGDIQEKDLIIINRNVFDNDAIVAGL